MRRFTSIAVVIFTLLLSSISLSQQATNPDSGGASSFSQEPQVATFIWNYNAFQKPQPNASFDIDGSGSVGGTYQLNGNTVLAADGKNGNLLVGLGAGNSQPVGFGNTLSGYQAGFGIYGIAMIHSRGLVIQWLAT